jgi:type II secretory pathway pseudopilin PulG
MSGAFGRDRERGWTILEILLVLGVVGLFLALALPNFHAARIRNDEAAAIRTLGELAKAQEVLRRAALIDENGDGRGEYAMLQELSGKSAPRHQDTRPPAPLPQFALLIGADGDADVCGYRFRLLLPGAGGAGVREAGTPGTPDPGLAASFWCAYAWPLRREGFVPAATGGRTFFVNQVGQVLAAEGEYNAIPAKEGGSTKSPEPGAAFLGPGPLGSITGAPALGTTGRDGLTWRVVQ